MITKDGRNSDVLVSCDATIFCDNFARWLQKMVEIDVWVSCDAMIFCNNFARWLQKMVEIQMCSAVGNSPHFSNESPFQTIRPNCQQRIQVEISE